MSSPIELPPPGGAVAATDELPPAEVFTISGYYATWIAAQVPKVRKALPRDYHRHFRRWYPEAVPWLHPALGLATVALAPRTASLALRGRAPGR